MSGLTIKRREGECCTAGDVHIEIAEIRGNWVKLRINAPDDVIISRDDQLPDRKPKDRTESD